MTKNEQETLLQTIKARLEWNQKGEVDFVPDENGQWIVVDIPKSKLIKHFTPNNASGFDKFGNPEP